MSYAKVDCSHLNPDAKRLNKGKSHIKESKVHIPFVYVFLVKV